MNFWEVFTALCADRHVTVNKVGSSVGISSGSITKYKTGSMPGAEALIKIADYFGVSVDYLLGREAPSSATMVNSENGIIGNGNTVTHSAGLDPMEEELLRLFRGLTIKEKVKLLSDLMGDD